MPLDEKERRRLAGDEAASENIKSQEQQHYTPSARPGKPRGRHGVEYRAGLGRVAFFEDDAASPLSARELRAAAHSSALVVLGEYEVDERFYASVRPHFFAALNAGHRVMIVTISRERQWNVIRTLLRPRSRAVFASLFCGRV